MLSFKTEVKQGAVNQKSGFSPVLCLQGGGVEGGKDLTPDIERVDPMKPRIPENDIVPDT